MAPILAPLAALQPGDLGPAVGNLHAILARLDLAANIPADETALRRLGPDTVHAVQALFAAAGLGDNPAGAIREEAAAKLNQFLVDRRLLSLVEGRASDAAGYPAVGYRVRINDERNLDGDAAADVLVQADGNWNAFYDPLFYLEARPGVIERTDTIVPVARAFDPDGAEAARSEPVPNPDGRARIELLIRGDIRPGPAQGGRRVRGWLENSGGAKLTGFTVEVFDRDIGPVRPEQSLGKVTIGPEGTFAIGYTVQTVEPGDCAPLDADLVFVVTDPNGRTEPRLQVLRQPVDGDPNITTELPVPGDDLPRGIPARVDEFVRLVAAAAIAPAGQPEFDALMEALRPLLNGRSPAVMDEAAYQDITFAARETGRDAGRIGDLAGAFRLAEGSLEGAAPAVLYALARTLELRDAAGIAVRPLKDLAAALKDAIPALIPDPGIAADAIAADVQRRAAQAALRVPAAGAGTGGLAAALQAHLPDAGEQAALMQDFANFEGSVPEFWRTWAQTNPGKPVDAIQFSVQLAAATSNHAPLATAILAAHPGVRSLRALTLELDAPKLRELMGETPPPGLGPDETPEVGMQRLASTVSGLLDASHPTAAVARLAANWAADAPHALSPGGAALMRRIVLDTDYELGSGGLDKLAETHADVLFQDMADPEVRAGALRSVSRIERLYKVSTGPVVLSTMATALGPGGKPFKGAFDIGELGKEAFLAAFKGQPPEMMQELSNVHENAQVFAEASASLLMGALYESADPPIAATKASTKTPAAAKSIPNWAQLFGTDRLTECPECRSLGGPAAYVVQALGYLNNRCPPNAAGIPPAVVLLGDPARGIPGIRPDLAHIKLSCENTDTMLPEIDLANEVLESCLVFGGALATPPNDSSPGLSSDELAAMPEHIQDKAYAMLAKAVFPISLPFDLAADETRAYLARAGSSREALIRLYRPGDADALADARLRLTALDHAIVTGTPAPDTPSPSLFALPPQGADPETGWAAALDPSLPKAATVLGLTVSDLLVLCATRFVSGAWSRADRGVIERLPLDTASLVTLRDAGFASAAPDVQAILDWLGISLAELKSVWERNVALVSRAIVADPPNQAKLDDMRLVHLDGTPLAEADWLRLHRMARLARRSSMAIPDLDLALAALGADAIDAGTLQALGALKSLGETLKLDWLETASLVGDPPAPLWERVFVRSGVAKADAALLPDAEGRIATAPAEPIAGHAVGLAAAFDLQVPDVIGMAEGLGLSTVDNPSVAGLWRMARLGSALGMAGSDLVQLANLSGQPPAADPFAMLAFVELANDIKPVLAEALHFAGIRPEADDAAMLKQAQDALAKAQGELAKSLPKEDVAAVSRRVMLETLAQSFSIPYDMLVPLVGKQDAPDLSHVQRLAYLIHVFGFKLPDLLVLLAAKALPDTNADPKALMAAFRRVRTYTGLANKRDTAALALALAALASPADAGWRDRVAGAVAACRVPRKGETEAASLAARQAVAADVNAILSLPLPWPPAPAPSEDPILALAWIDARLALAATVRARAQSLIDLAEGAAAGGLALQDLKQGVQAGYEPATWLQVSRHIHDPLRQARRDALVAFIKQQKGLENDEAVFSTLLADPGVNPVVMTSRLSNLIRTIGRFVTAVRLGRLSGEDRPAAERVDASQITPEWDRTLYSSRMTQANFEVLANPYFYMAPDLRDDKSPGFQEMQGFLKQNDPTPGNARKALLTYLERLGEVSNLEICGTYLQDGDFDSDEAFRFKSVLHVFGRSRGGIKRSYFYRRLNRYEHMQEWTPWEPVKADIQAVERDRSTTRDMNDTEGIKPEAGVHLLPVVWRRKLHIFWPTFVRKIVTADEQPEINIKSGKSTAELPKPYWEVKLCWSTHENGEWTPRQMSSDYHETFV